MTFHYLVRGICRVDDHVLLVREIGATTTFLPGGHIESGEPAERALVREIRKEIGREAVIRRHVGAVEHMWPDGALDNHEINL